MNIVEVKGVRFGEGMPKICVPIVEVTKEEIIKEVKRLKGIQADVIEWRVDWFERAFQWNEVCEVLEELYKLLEGRLLLFTFRTKKEGGEKEISPKDYQTLLEQVACSHLVDFLDMELFMGEEVVVPVIQKAHLNGIKVIASSHDFEKTPPKHEIIKRLCRMQELGADLLKIAVMPCEKKDVLILLEATLEMQEVYAKQPLITMSMTKQGGISRLCGELFGSSMTFGSSEKESASGQVEVQKLQQFLIGFHEIMN